LRRRESRSSCFDVKQQFRCEMVWARLISNREADERAFDFRFTGFNNPRMARPDAVRRVKSYSAANGYVYQYCFYEVNRIVDEEGSTGEFIYAISTDRQSTFGLRILVRQAALQAWARENGRPLSTSEEYAVAKMRLFQAFDEGAVPLTAKEAATVSLIVDESNLDELLRSLNI
jgi:hypothetical protein